MQILSYHERVAAFFKAKTQLWHYFSAPVQETVSSSLQNELLKTTYRLSPEAEPHVYEAVATARQTLGISQEVTLYQQMHSDTLNARVYTLPEAVHIVFSGPAIKLLEAAELLAVLGHELGHVLLFNQEDYNTGAAILDALSCQPRASNSYMETARLFDLYTELFCDSMALKVTSDSNAAIASLVKMSTGLSLVSAESYVRQAIEIFGNNQVVSEQHTHPEMFIRAYALHLQATQPGNWQELIRPVIEGCATLNQLDIFGRQELAAYTRNCMDWLLAGDELQNPSLAQLFNEYFPGEKPGAASLPGPMAGSIGDTSCKDYLAYTLLDFALSDKEHEETVLERAFVLADAAGISEQLAAALKKELKLSNKKYNERFKKIMAV